MKRRTKIVATLGPATDSAEVLERIIRAGVSVVRLNFSHGTADDHRTRAEAVRLVASKLGCDVGILADLQGPKIRIEKFRNGPIQLQTGQTFVLDTSLDESAGDENQVGCSYKQLPSDVKTGHTLLLNDGLIAMCVEAVEGSRVICKVREGGELSDRKGLNLQGGGLSAGALTDKDLADIKTAAALDVDFLAVSFPKTAADIHTARKHYTDAGGRGQILAKIERAEAIVNLEEIIEASDSVMVARGDLGVEIGDAELPGVQKRMIALAREMNRTVVTATQMMESMIQNPAPTRAEVLDVANAVIDGTDAVMLSAETSIGSYPVKTVEAMARVCEGAERQETTSRSTRGLRSHFERTDEAISMTAIYTARNMKADAIVALTESGATALWMSRVGTTIPIYAMTRHEYTRRRMTICRGVYPIQFDPSELEGIVPIREAIACLKERNLLRTGHKAIVTKGDYKGEGGTNTMKIVTVE